MHHTANGKRIETHNARTHGEHVARSCSKLLEVPLCNCATATVRSRTLDAARVSIYLASSEKTPTGEFIIIGRTTPLLATHSHSTFFYVLFAPLLPSSPLFACRIERGGRMCVSLHHRPVVMSVKIKFAAFSSLKICLRSAHWPFISGCERQLYAAVS